MEDDLRRAIEWALSERYHAADAPPGAKGKGGDVTSADGSSEVERLVSEVARCRGKIAAQDETLRTRELELQACNIPLHTVTYRYIPLHTVTHSGARAAGAISATEIVAVLAMAAAELCCRDRNPLTCHPCYSEP